MADVYVRNPQFPWIEPCERCGAQKHIGSSCEDCALQRAGRLTGARQARWIRGSLEMFKRRLTGGK